MKKKLGQKCNMLLIMKFAQILPIEFHWNIKIAENTQFFSEKCAVKSIINSFSAAKQRAPKQTVFS